MALHEQIIADMKHDITRIITTKITSIRNEITSKLTELHTKISTKVHQQIAEVLQTIQTLNQRFTKVLDRLPPTTTTMPAHKKPKGLGIIN